MLSCLCFFLLLCITAAEEATVHRHEFIRPIGHRFSWWVPAAPWWQHSNPTLDFLCYTSFHHLSYQLSARLFWKGSLVDSTEQWFCWRESHSCQGTFLLLTHASYVYRKLILHLDRVYWTVCEHLVNWKKYFLFLKYWFYFFSLYFT